MPYRTLFHTLVPCGLAIYHSLLSSPLPTPLTSQTTAALTTPSYQTRYAMLVLATTGAFGGLPSLNAWVGDNVRSTTARSLSIALNIAFSGPGQIMGVWIYRAQDRPFYRLGNSVNAGMAFLAAGLSLGLSLYYRRLNKRLGPGEQKWMM